MINSSPFFLLSKVSDGTMRVGDGETIAADNRQRFFSKNNIDPTRVVIARLASGNNVMIVSNDSSGKIIQNVDGLITTSKDINLTLTVADCLPVVLYSPDKLIALLHCGWRGLDTGIIKKAVTIARKLGISPQDFSAIIGPGIAGHHYPVEPQMAERFEMYPGALVKNDNEILLDIKTVAKQQLEQLGIDKIEISPICTYCDKSYFSARRNKLTPVPVMMAIVRL